MINVTEDKNRIGIPTSSQIYRLMGSPAVKKTYEQEKKFERYIKKSIKPDADSKSTSWGHLMELYVNKHYMPIGMFKWDGKAVKHPEYELSGTPDIVGENTIGDIKGYGALNFCKFAEIAKDNDLETFKKEMKEAYWQVTSNAFIFGYTRCLLLAYLPYESELESIRDFACDPALPDFNRFRFVVESENRYLAHQSDESDFNNVVIFEWDVVEEDIEKLKKELVLTPFDNENS